MTTTTMTHSASCSNCGFTTRDSFLLARHSCDVQQFGGHCEDYPCCGHEAGDCNGLRYGSEEAIRADPHLLCDHEVTGYCCLDDDEMHPDD